MGFSAPRCQPPHLFRPCRDTDTIMTSQNQTRPVNEIQRQPGGPASGIRPAAASQASDCCQHQARDGPCTWACSLFSPDQTSLLTHQQVLIRRNPSTSCSSCSDVGVCGWAYVAVCGFMRGYVALCGPMWAYVGLCEPMWACIHQALTFQQAARRWPCFLFVNGLAF